MASDHSMRGKLRRGYLRTKSSVKKNVFNGSVGRTIRENPEYKLDENHIAHFPCFEWKEKTDEPELVIHNDNGHVHPMDAIDGAIMPDEAGNGEPLISRYYLDWEDPNKLKEELNEFKQFMKSYKFVPGLQKVRGMGFTVGVGSGTSELMVRFSRLERHMITNDPLPVYKTFSLQRPRARLERLKEGIESTFDYTHYPSYLIMRSKRNAESLQQSEPIICKTDVCQLSKKMGSAIKNLAGAYRAHERLTQVARYFDTIRKSVDASLENPVFKNNVLHGNVIHDTMCVDPVGHASLNKACKVTMEANAASRNTNTNCNVAIDQQTPGDRGDMTFHARTNRPTDDPIKLDVLATLDQIVNTVDLNKKYQAETKFGPRLRMLPSQRLKKPTESYEDVWISRNNTDSLNPQLYTSPKKSAKFVHKRVTINEDLNEVYDFPRAKKCEKVKMFIRNIVNKLFK